MKLILRPWKHADLDSLVRYANNIKIAKNLSGKFPFPYSEQNGLDFIAYSASHTPRHSFAIEIGGEAIGGIGIHPKDDIDCKNAELGYWIGEPFWGRGIVTAAIGQIIDYGFDTFDISRIFARTYGTNIASQRVLQKAGFVLEAQLSKTLFKNGEFFDEFIFAVRRK